MHDTPTPPPGFVATFTLLGTQLNTTVFQVQLFLIILVYTSEVIRVLEAYFSHRFFFGRGTHYC